MEECFLVPLAAPSAAAALPTQGGGMAMSGFRADGSAGAGAGAGGDTTAANVVCAVGEGAVCRETYGAVPKTTMRVGVGAR